MTLYSNTNRKASMKIQATGASWATGGTYALLAEFLSLKHKEGSEYVDNAKAFNGREGASLTGSQADALEAADLAFSKVFNPGTDGIILEACWGASTPTTLETGVYSHAAALAAAIADLAGNFAISEVNGPTTLEHIGLKVNTWSLKMAGEDQPVILSGTLLGKSTSTGASFPTVSATALADLYWSSCTFSHNAAGLSFVRNVELSGNNGLLVYRNGAITLAEPKRQSALPKLKFDLLMEDLAWNTLKRAGTLQQFIITITGRTKCGATQYPGLTITIPSLRIDDVVMDDSKTGLKVATITATPIGNGSDNYFTTALVNTTAVMTA